MAKEPATPEQSENEELVRTPGGWRPKSKVHFVPPGHHVSGKGDKIAIVETATGKVVKDLGPIEKPDKGVKRDGKAMSVAGQAIGPANIGPATPLPGPGPAGPPAPAPVTNGWIVYSGWTNTSANPISYFKSRWAVPPAPATDNGQLIYLFNGIESTGSDLYILQPVLQWGSSPAGGGSYWAITNWYVGSSSTGVALYGSLTQVNPGDVLEGVMTLTGQTGSNFNYLSSFTGHSSADLNVTNVAELTWANETLECYNFSAFSDYPDTILTAFHDIEIRLRTSTSPFTEAQATINWTANNDVTDNGQQCVIVSNASPGGDVYLYYRANAQSMYFVNDKSTFGKDEVTDVIANSGGLYPNAFYVMLDGFTPDQLAIGQFTPLTPVLSGQFSAISGVTITANSSSPEYQLPGDIYAPQRIRFPFDIRFASTALSAFPAAGNVPVQKPLAAQMTIGGTAENAFALFELVAGANPYFTDVDAAQDNVFWLSQDLRVFSAAPAINNVPVPGGPAFSSDSVGGAYAYIQSLLSYLNANFSNPSGTDPFGSLLPGQSGALTGDSSVSPVAIGSLFPLVIGNNYNFAIARVRLRGSAGPSSAANDVKVFFRMWSTQSADTDYQPGSTYLSNLDGNGLPDSPISAADGHTIPFFATGNSPNFGDPNNLEYGSAGANNRTIEITSGDSVWAYFGCFLNVYDAANIVGGSPVQALLAGTHHCIVAQIAYDGAPIVNANGVTMSPANSDKLAQRNLIITHSDNPGPVDTHRVPQTFDTRPSRPLVVAAGNLLDYPDELMIDWGKTPQGSIASIYWPGVDTNDVVAMASKLYSTHQLSAPDSRTVQCTVTRGVTYVPILSGSGENFAGLMTIDLPTSVVKGQEFNVIIRRISSRGAREGVRILAAATDNRKGMRNWRYVTGAFQIRIPVGDSGTFLASEETTLAIMKWRLNAMSPSNRWYPVLERYIGYISARIDGLGGNSQGIEPSLGGAPVEGRSYEGRGFTGKICEVFYDCFGDFEGFLLISCCTEKHRFASRRKGIGAIAQMACEKQLPVTVFTDGKARPEVICGIAIGCGC